jgi:transposase
VRVTTLLRRLLRVISLVVVAFRWEEGDLVISVRPQWRRPRCGGCHRKAPGYDGLGEPRRWRALPWGPVVVWLEYTMRRVDCPECGVRVERVPWAELGSRFTADFEEMAAYLAQLTDKTAVTKLLGLSWRAVGHIIERVVADRLDPDRLVGLRRIGIDEFSYRKGQMYLTIVVDHDRQRVVWAAPGRGADTLKKFFDDLGLEGVARLQVISLDMAAGYLKAIREHAPHAQVIFDRFHVQRLASEAVDKVRRTLWREYRDSPQGKAIKRSRWALLRRPWNRTDRDDDKLYQVQRTNKPLYRAHLLNATLADALDHRKPTRAREALDEWLSWAPRSRLAPFVRVARTIRKHKEGILAYIKERLTNGIVEGFNNRLRMICRRAFGFHSERPVIGMLFLCCGDIPLYPPLPTH